VPFQIQRNHAHVPSLLCLLINTMEENMAQKTCVKLTSLVRQPSLANIWEPSSLHSCD